MHDTSVLVKATPYRALVHFLDKELDSATRARVFDSAAREFPESESLIRRRLVIASELVPVALMDHLVKAAAVEVGVPAVTLAQRAGRAGAEEASTLIFRFAMAVISIPNLIRKIPPGWKQLYSHGTMNVQCEANRADVELLDFPVVSDVTCGRVTGWFEWFAQAADRSAAASHVRCRATGATSEGWVIEW